MNYSKLCENCWRMIISDSEDAPELCELCTKEDMQVDLDSVFEMTPMMWATFPHYQVYERATVDGVLDDNGNSLVFDFVIPECRLAIDFVKDNQLLPSVADEDEKHNRVSADDAKDLGTRQVNYRWIVLSEDDVDVRNKLVSIINEVYVKDVDGGVHVLTPRLQGDVGWDLVCDADTLCPPGVGTDIPSQVFLEIPNHLYAIVQARSSTSKKRLLVLPGVLDPSYRGQIFTMTFNPTSESVMIKKGDRISQLLFFYRIPHLHINPVTELRKSERGPRGFGSTG